MEITVLVGPRATCEKRNLIHLEPDLGWNDWWEFQTQYNVNYYDATGNATSIGYAKFATKATVATDAPTMSLQEGEYESVECNWFSIGQGEKYYEHLASLDPETRDRVVALLGDMVANPRLYFQNRELPVVRRSLMREVSVSDLEEKFRRILTNEKDPLFYELVYRRGLLELDFVVDPGRKPASNLHVLIGTNGVGKTTLLKSIAKHVTKAVSDNDGPLTGASIDMRDEDGNLVESVFNAVQFISWSAFDSFSEIDSWKFAEDVIFSKIGIDGIKRRGRVDGLWSNSELTDNSEDGLNGAATVASFRASCQLIALDKRKKDLWWTALSGLDSDPIFSALNVFKVCMDATPEELASFFSQLSDGHKVVLLTLTYLSATLEEKTLILLDEPEAHLHPPLLSALIHSFNRMLRRQNAVAIAATHSPVVLQEVPSESVHILDRGENNISSAAPDIECYGEDVGLLTHEVFALQVAKSGYCAEIDDVVQASDDYKQALARLGGRLGGAGRALLRTKMSYEVKRREEEEKRRSQGGKN